MEAALELMDYSRAVRMLRKVQELVSEIRYSYREDGALVKMAEGIEEDAKQDVTNSLRRLNEEILKGK